MHPSPPLASKDGVCTQGLGKLPQFAGAELSRRCRLGHPASFLCGRLQRSQLQLLWWSVHATHACGFCSAFSFDARQPPPTSIPGWPRVCKSAPAGSSNDTSAAELPAGCHCPADPALPSHISAVPGAAWAEGWAPCLPVPGDLQLTAAFQVSGVHASQPVTTQHYDPLWGHGLETPILCVSWHTALGVSLLNELS